MACLSGVEFTRDKKSETPKHLRVGINSAMVNDDGLATLLIKKGLITEVEYYEEIADAMERERIRYEKLLASEYGAASIKLA